jgi:hypothetical protein
MAESTEAVALHEFIHNRLRYYPNEIELDELKEAFADLLALEIDDKADKVSGATAGHFASLVLDAGTGKYNIADSGYNGDTFAKSAHNHDTRYIRKDTDDTFDSAAHTLTFSNDATHAPFAVTDGTTIITNLNAEKLGGYKASNFSLSSHNHDSRYIRIDVDQTLTKTLTFQIPAGGASPFAVDSTNTGVVTYLNADYLDDHHATDFSLKDHTHDTRYLRLNANNSYDAATYVFTWALGASPSSAPFVITASGSGATGLVSRLNAEYLNGHADSYFATASHTHDDRYYTETEVDALLDAKITDPAASGDGYVLVWSGGVALTAANLFSELALLTDIADKANKVSGATANNFAKLVLSGGVKYDIADSGYSASDFATASHTHDDRYYTETELGNYSTALALASGSTIESGTYYIAGSDGVVTPGTPTPGGTVVMRVNGADITVITT